jgi:hypothetical protein
MSASSANPRFCRAHPWILLWIFVAASGFASSAAGAESAELFVRGDADQSGRLDLADAVGTLQYLFALDDGRDGLPCLDAADADDSGTVDLNDPILLLNFLFLRGEAPPPPFPGCGADPTDDGIGCEEPKPCAFAFEFYGREFAADGVFFLIERSGAMTDSGELAVAKRALLHVLFCSFQEAPRDLDFFQFGIVFFDRGTMRFPATGRPGREASISAAAEFILDIPGGGGSCLLQGLQAVVPYLEASTARRNLVVILSWHTGVRGLVATDPSTFVEDALAGLGIPQPDC